MARIKLQKVPVFRREQTGNKLPAERAADAPLYIQVASTLKTAIVRGIYPVGSRIPTESELCERFEVSRHTVRDALKRLRADGLISSRQGGRPIVVPPSALKSVRLFSAEMGKDFFDHTMGTRLDIKVMDLIPNLPRLQATYFGVVPGEPWFLANGYRQPVDHGAIISWTEYLIRPEYAAVGRLLARHVGPVIPLVEDLFSERIVKVSQSMTALAMPDEHAAKFGVAAGSPSLKISTRCENADDKLLLISVSLHPGGEIAYSIRLHSDS
jgi:GntR family transcriptional regulator